MSFDLLAPHYRWMEFVLAGGKLQRCRARHLPKISSANSILLLGEGHGRFLPECLRRFPQAAVTCLDSSAGMLRQARARLNGDASLARIEWICADALHWAPPPARFDLLATNFFFDCFRPDQIRRLVEKIAPAAAPGAHWLVADFQTAERGLRRVRSRVILWSMYLFFTTVTGLPARRLSTPDEALAAAGFHLKSREEFEWGLLRSDWWQKA
ncbi:MAG TPA: class I SAM-dependent methyltransferase [Verrucomicrobiae bacterium]|nr:class I SAM-dependent methyltransferase [Verrucomicrobiae bacterium]